MKRPPAMPALAVLALVAALWLIYSLMIKPLYFVPRSALMHNRDEASASLAQYRKSQNDHARVQAELRGFIDRTLGDDLETVEHKLRTRLNRLHEHVQLQNASVGTSSAGRRQESPAKMKFKGALNRELREEIDFIELEGWLSGSGTFEQVLRLVQSIEAEPWIKRIDQLRLDPKENGAVFLVNIRLTTLYLPGQAPNPANVVAGKAAGFDRYLPLVRANPFRQPMPAPAPAVTSPQPIADPSQTVTFPYEQWTLTGLAQSAAGPEIWLINQQTRQSRRMVIGESLQDAILVAANAQAAEFQIGQQRFLVGIGKNLGDRTPVNQ